MGLFRFILGVLGVLLVIGAFSSFIPLVFLGGISSGSVAFAFGFPIFLIILGVAMIYFGFYYSGFTNKNSSQLIMIAKWGAINTVAIFLANYIISKLMFVNNLLIILFTAAMVSIITQIVKSHKSQFKIKWFLFYFLIYANIIWAMGEFFLPKTVFQSGLFSFIVVGFTIAGVVVIIQRLNVRQHSIPWISIILVIILLVANLDSLELSPIKLLLEKPINSSELLEEKRECPTAISGVLNRSLVESAFDPKMIGPTLNKLITTSIWDVEGDIRSCYKGKYKGQFPGWLYCDDMIVSRWETSNSGTIKYRWYTAVTAEWKPVSDTDKSHYVFDNFSCENGKKVTVDKETTAYYVHVSRDGTEIKIEY
jgi:hypothetical protein